MIPRAQASASGSHFTCLLELEQEAGILVPGKQPEQDPVGQLERAAGPGPLQLEQPPVLGDGPDVLDALGGRRRQAQQVAAPGPIVLLLLDDRQRRLGLHDGSVGGLDLRGTRSRAGPARVRVRYRIDGPAFSSSQVSGIRCWFGSSRSAPVAGRAKRRQNRLGGWQAEGTPARTESGGRPVPCLRTSSRHQRVSSAAASPQPPGTPRSCSRPAGSGRRLPAPLS